MKVIFGEDFSKTTQKIEPGIIHSLTIGGYTILCLMNRNTVWIIDRDGYKVEVTTEKFADLIADFYYEES